MELRRRERKILAVIIALYLQKGRAVASHQVSSAPGQRLSAASIRNLMAELEEKGFLFRSHASAGCIPTDAALRFFVDETRVQLKISAAMRRGIESRFEEMGPEHVDDPVWIARLAADVTRDAGIVVRPMDVSPLLESLSLIDMGGSRVLGVIVSTNGWVGKRALSLPEAGRKGELHLLAARVSERWRGCSFDDIRSLLENQQEGSPFVDWEYSLLLELFSGEEEGEVQVTGAENLMEDDAFSEIERIRNAVRVLGNRPGIAAEWRKALQDRETCVFIGAESPLTSSGSLGMVATLFYRGPRRAGAVGVVGPRRMNYMRVVPMIECIAQTLSRRLGGGAA